LPGSETVTQAPNDLSSQHVPEAVILYFLVEEVDHPDRGLDLAIQAGCDQIHHGALIDDKALHGILENELFFVPTLRVTSRQNMAIKYGAGRPWGTRKMGEAAENLEFEKAAQYRDEIARLKSEVA